METLVDDSMPAHETTNDSSPAEAHENLETENIETLVYDKVENNPDESSNTLEQTDRAHKL